MEDLIKVEFVGNNVKFSAHDVTARLRELVLQQGVIGAIYPIDITETGTVMVQQYRVARIEHSDVREIVHALFDGGEIPAYSREMNGQYFEYIPDQTASAPPAPSDPSPITPSSGPWSVI